LIGHAGFQDSVVWAKVCVMGRDVHLKECDAMTFEIYSVEVGAGLVGIAPMPSAADFDTIRDWGTTMVITMTERRELRAAGMAGFGRVIIGMGIRWYELPVADYGVPVEPAENPTGRCPIFPRNTWSLTARRACEMLADGGRILIHCRGGCGRSGMAALRLMIEMGEDADDALTRLRAVRPCAVETDAQLAWARDV
jgi:hypothetical protein